MEKRDGSAGLKDRGLLVHVTHYDPQWCARKAREGKFDPDVAIDLIEAIAQVGFNVLVIDCKDGVAYKSHPELRRRYTVPMAQLKLVADAAREHGIEVIPKCNFSKSGLNQHDEWLAPHVDLLIWNNKLDEYYRVAADVIAELVATCRPSRFFHIGMDEDHWRTLGQYADAIKTLRSIVRKHRLRPIIWNDSCHLSPADCQQVHADKSRDAEKLIPKDILHVLWDYAKAHPPIVKRLRKEGFEVWAAPGASLAKVRDWRKAVVAGDGQGLLMTRWIKCNRANRDVLLNMVRDLGPEY